MHFNLKLVRDKSLEVKVSSFSSSTVFGKLKQMKQEELIHVH